MHAGVFIYKQKYKILFKIERMFALQLPQWYNNSRLVKIYYYEVVINERAIFKSNYMRGFH